MQCLQKWLELEPDAPQALYWRGEAWERLHRFEEALTDFQRVIDLRPDRDDARLRLATALVTAHRPAEAVGHYELLHAKHPDASGVVLGLARCRVELGHADEARQLLDDLLPSRPNDGLALGERGKIELLAGSADDAERWLRRAAAAAPYEREVVYNLIQALQKRGKSAEAADWTARLDKIDTDLERMNELLRKIHGSPKDPASRHEAGAILMRNGQEIEGVRWLMNALKQDPDYRPSHELLADYYERHGNPELAAMHRRAAQGHATSPMP
jgi:predicted Zn-dependent protease